MKILQMLQQTSNVFQQGRNRAPGGESTISRSLEADKALDTETRQLVKCVLGENTGMIFKPRWNESEAVSTMKRVVDNVLWKYRYTYNGMINGLSLDDSGYDVRFVSAVAKSLFADGTVNWGRVVSLLAFGAALSHHLKDKGNENCMELVGEEISVYLLTDQRDWLIKNNSWDGFVEFFREADRESMLANVLLTIAGFAGIGAILTLLIM